jgi:hypothetical protein
MIKTIKNILWLWVFKEIYDTKLEIQAEQLRKELKEGVVK